MSSGNKYRIKDKLPVVSRDKIELIPYSEITHFIARSNYTSVYLLDGSSRLVSKNLKEFTKNLLCKDFIQIHRSFIVRIDEIKFFYKTNSELELKDGSVLSVSRERRKMILKLCSGDFY